MSGFGSIRSTRYADIFDRELVTAHDHRHARACPGEMEDCLAG